MIVTTFTIELDTGLSHLLQSALRLANDRSRDTHRRERSKRSYGHCRRRTEIPESERGAPPVYGKHPTSTTLSNAFRSAPRLMSGPRLSVGPSPGPVAPLSSIGLLSAIQELVKPQIALNAASGKQHRGPAFAPPKLPRRFKQNLNDLVRVGPVGLEPTTYGVTGVHRLPRVTPVAKRALPGSEQATCGQLGRLRDSIVAPERRVTSRSGKSTGVVASPAMFADVCPGPWVTVPGLLGWAQTLGFWVRHPLAHRSARSTVGRIPLVPVRVHCLVRCDPLRPRSEVAYLVRRLGALST
jgi:hypothetical protein